MADIKCSKCGKSYRIGAEQVGIDDRGLPIIHRFGYCDICMLKNDLDTQRYNNYTPSWFNYYKGLVALTLSIFGMFTLVWGIGMICSPIALFIGINSVRHGTIYKKSAIWAIIIAFLCTVLSIITIIQIIMRF